MLLRASAKVMNQCWLRHASRSRPLKLSIYGFCVGLPGSLTIRLTWCAHAHVASARPHNAGLCSTRTAGGTPRVWRSRSTIGTTRAPGNDVSTSVAIPSRGYSSLMVSTRKRRPSPNGSCMTSNDHTCAAACANTRSAPRTPARRRRALRRTSGRLHTTGDIPLCVWLDRCPSRCRSPCRR